MLRRTLLIAVGLFVQPLSALALDQYLCVGEQATGFKWEGGRWVIAKFNTEHDKFIVQEIPKQGRFNFLIKRIGESEATFHCERGETAGVKYDRILCGGLLLGMLIDKKLSDFMSCMEQGTLRAKTAVAIHQI